ncbi:MAG: hypothetical protein KKC18_16120, partial [Chloroflexi bacterium]|nr:hypothetical protein [Chloroflexota bacterium]
MNKNTTRILTSLCLLTSLLLSACGGTSPEAIDALARKIAVPIIATYEAGAQSPAAQLTPTPASRSAATPTPLSMGMDLASSQELHLAACCPGSDFTIDSTQVWGGTDAQIVTEAFVGLTRQNEGTAQVEPGMATSWD